jgi:drug/metabolite transporter (DMT)-like permease
MMTYKEGFYKAIEFPRNIFSLRMFYVRGLLTVITQVTFLLAISTNDLMLVWPILNTTGLTGAIFAYLFLGERLRPKDFVFILLTFFLTGLTMILLNYEKY